MKPMYNLDFARANKIRIKGNRRIVPYLVWITGVSAITGCPPVLSPGCDDGEPKET